MSNADEIDLDPALASGVTATGSVDTTGSVSSVEASDSVDTIAATRAIADGLATGALDPVAAQGLLIDQVLAEQLAGVLAGVDPEQVERIRGELASLLAGDPTLAALLQP